MNFYDVLDVPQNATSEQIKSHYRILVQLFHPDRLQHANSQVREYAEERLKRINVAYSTLSDPLKRAKYDDDNDIVTAVPAARSKRRRKKAAEPSEPEPMYAQYGYYNDEDIEEWLRQENERRRREETEFRNRQAQDAEAMRSREAHERARRAAEANLPRVQIESDWLVLHLTPEVSTTLLKVKEGEFLMGSDLQRDPDAREDELPQHSVHLTEYYISKYPITNYQYQLFKDATEPRRFGETGRSGHWQSPPGKELHPVVNVSWDEATAFCMWLSQETGVIFRLPTEAEWEKAARGDAGHIFPWGDQWEAGRANANEESSGTTPVGQYSPLGDSPYGLSDASGNVWEWCADRYDKEEYMGRKKVTRNPYGPEEGEGIVVRGGAFDKDLHHARCAHRNWYYPFNRRRDVGFRVVAEPF